MKSLVLALALSSASAFASSTYECYNPQSKNNNGFFLQISADQKTLTFSGVNAPAHEVVLASAQDAKSGYAVYTGEVGCVPTSHNKLPTCGAIGIVTLEVSHQLLEGAVQGDLVHGDIVYHCELPLK